MQQWYDLENVASSIKFNTDTDALIWQYESGRGFILPLHFTQSLILGVLFLSIYLLFGNSTYHLEYMFFFGSYLRTSL
jgi:hypothetical protein